jgi:tetratricopeptide (TPR) repeat protein
MAIGQRQEQLARFLELLSKGAPLAQSFQQAFKSDYATLERELGEYVRQNTYGVKLVPYIEPENSAGELKTIPTTEAKALAYLGDLLLHNDRGDEAEKHLNQALTLTPELSAANASLGMLRARQRNFPAAKEHLRRAITSDPQNYLAQYYYAYALSREAMDRGQTVTGYPAESAAQMRTALTKAIEIAPGFPESYRLLAFLNLALTPNSMKQRRCWTMRWPFLPAGTSSPLCWRKSSFVARTTRRLGPHWTR